MVTSVVSLVTMEGVENLSMDWKSYSWTLSNMALLRFDANPADAKGAVIPAATPNERETRAAPIRNSPYLATAFMLPP